MQAVAGFFCLISMAFAVLCAILAAPRNESGIHMKPAVLQRSLGLGALGLVCAALLGCAGAELVSPGARGLKAEQSAWIISDDDVQLVSLNGAALRSSIKFENNTFEDGVRDKLQVEPGSHLVEVRLDNGKYSVKEPMKLRLEAEADMTYYVTLNPGPPMGYQVHAFVGAPDKELLATLNR
jgi:hypothetical protein